MNKWIGIGNLTREPEQVKGTDKTLCRMTMAVTDGYVDKDGKLVPEFVNVIIWGTTADNCLKYLHKGSKVSVVGKLQTRKWETEDGVTKYAIEVLAREIEYLSSKKKETEDKGEFKPVDDDNLPF